MTNDLLKPALVYLAAVFGAGFLLGTLRVLLVVPRLGVRTAELMEMPLMLVVTVLVARWLAGRYLSRARPSRRLAVGLLALAILLTAEVGVGVGLRGLSIEQALFDRDPISGTAYYLLLILFGLLPWLLGRRKVLN